MDTEQSESVDDTQVLFRSLMERSDRIAEQWLEEVKVDRSVPSSDSVSEPQLMDSVPEVLEQVFEVAAGKSEAIHFDRLSCAEKHGRERAAFDFDPRELVREYQVLRHVIFQEVQRSVAENGVEAGVAVGACQQLGAALDEALRATIGAFVEAQTDDLRQKSRRDSLTGLLNHRSFYDELDRELKMASRTGRPLSVVILDLDRFKGINDQLGHRVGDRVLVAWAEKLTSRLRETDIVSRYGGDEFAAILPFADRKSTETLLEGLSREPVRLDALGLRTTEGTERTAVRVSWGIAESPADGTTSVNLVEKADARLLEVKKRSRPNPRP